MCHQCGETKPVPQTCPSCEAEDRLAPVGPGVERLGEEARRCSRRPDRDAQFGHVRLSPRAEGADREIAEGEADIVIGTQLVAKGHNFPALTLVGVIDADLGLQGSDLRAAERTFQLMRQVAGRAGRAEKRGCGAVTDLSARTSGDPRDPVGRRGRLLARRSGRAPPCGGAALRAHGRDHPLIARCATVFDLGTQLARRDAPVRAIGAQVFGPAPAPDRARPGPAPGASAGQGAQGRRARRGRWRNGSAS